MLAEDKPHVAELRRRQIQGRIARVELGKSVVRKPGKIRATNLEGCLYRLGKRILAEIVDIIRQQPREEPLPLATRPRLSHNAEVFEEEQVLGPLRDRGLQNPAHAWQVIGEHVRVNGNLRVNSIPVWKRLGVTGNDGFPLLARGEIWKQHS